jgi:hypothetical protein
METGPVYEISCFLVLLLQMMDKVQKPSDSECYAPMPEPYRIWIWSGLCVWQEKTKYSENTNSNASLCTTNPAWPDLRLITGCQIGKLATSFLKYGSFSAVRKTVIKVQPPSMGLLFSYDLSVSLKCFVYLFWFIYFYKNLQVGISFLCLLISQKKCFLSVKFACGKHWL